MAAAAAAAVAVEAAVVVAAEAAFAADPSAGWATCGEAVVVIRLPLDVAFDLADGAAAVARRLPVPVGKGRCLLWVAAQIPGAVAV